MPPQITVKETSLDATDCMIVALAFYGIGCLFWTVWLWAVLEEPVWFVPLLMVLWPVLIPALFSVAAWDALRARKS